VEPGVCFGVPNLCVNMWMGGKAGVCVCLRVLVWCGSLWQCAWVVGMKLEQEHARGDYQYIGLARTIYMYIYAVYTVSLQGFNQIHGHTRRKYTVLADLTSM
jgi:hypothetical protein